MNVTINNFMLYSLSI